MYEGDIRTQLAASYLTNWGKHVHECVMDWANKPLLCEASVSRHFSRRHEEINYLEEKNGMAKTNFKDSSWKGFVDVPLSQEAKDQYAAWDVADSDVWDGLATYGEKGYKFSLVWSKNNSTWIATYTGQEGTGANEGWAVSARARHPYDAARVLLFKVAVLLPDKWKDFKADAADDIA